MTSFMETKIALLVPKSGAKMMVAKNTHMFLKNKTENTLQCIHVFGGKL